MVLAHQVAGLSGTSPASEYLEIEVTSNSHSSIDVSGWKVVSTVTGASGTIPQGAQMLKLGPVSLQDIILKPGDKATITTGVSPVSVSFDQNTCANFLTQADAYNQCFANQSADANFLTGPWRIYLDKSARLWKNSGETIELIDSNGKIVDSFSY